MSVYLGHFLVRQFILEPHLATWHLHIPQLLGFVALQYPSAAFCVVLRLWVMFGVCSNAPLPRYSYISISLIPGFYGK